MLLIATQFGYINLNMSGRCSHDDINAADMFSLNNRLAVVHSDSLLPFAVGA